MQYSALSLRAAACIEDLDDGCEWSIYIFNDEAFAIDQLELISFGHSFGDYGSLQDIGRLIGSVPAGRSMRLWRDDDFEMRMYMMISLEVRGVTQKLMADFPKLYRRKRNLPRLEPIGLCGLAVPFQHVS